MDMQRMSLDKMTVPGFQSCLCDPRVVGPFHLVHIRSIGTLGDALFSVCTCARSVLKRLEVRLFAFRQTENDIH